MEILTPASLTPLEKRCQEVAEHYINLGNRLFTTSVKMPQIVFNIKDGLGGQARIGKGIMRLNPTMLRQNGEAYVMETVPHEVGHFIACAKFPRALIDPHGTEWRAIMLGMGLKPNRCHSFNTDKTAEASEKRFMNTVVIKKQW